MSQDSGNQTDENNPKRFKLSTSTTRTENVSSIKQSSDDLCIIIALFTGYIKNTIYSLKYKKSDAIVRKLNRFYKAAVFTIRSLETSRDLLMSIVNSNTTAVNNSPSTSTQAETSNATKSLPPNSNQEVNRTLQPDIAHTSPSKISTKIEYPKHKIPSPSSKHIHELNQTVGVFEAIVKTEAIMNANRTIPAEKKAELSRLLDVARDTIDTVTNQRNLIEKNLNNEIQTLPNQVQLYFHPLTNVELETIRKLRGAGINDVPLTEPEMHTIQNVRDAGLNDVPLTGPEIQTIRTVRDAQLNDDPLTDIECASIKMIRIHPKQNTLTVELLKKI